MPQTEFLRYSQIHLLNQCYEIWSWGLLGDILMNGISAIIKGAPESSSSTWGHSKMMAIYEASITKIMIKWLVYKQEQKLYLIVLEAGNSPAGSMLDDTLLLASCFMLLLIKWVENGKVIRNLHHINLIPLRHS